MYPMRGTVLIALFAMAPFLSAAGQESGGTAVSTGDILLDPSQITLTERLEAPSRLATVELAVRQIEAQIDAKRATDAARSPAQPLWDLAVWRYLPADPARTLNSRVTTEDDPFFTPDYLKVSSRQLENQMHLSETVALKIFDR